MRRFRPAELCETRPSGAPAWLPDEPDLCWSSTPLCVRVKRRITILEGPTRLPRLPDEQAELPRFGRPRLCETAQEQVEFAAFAHGFTALPLQAITAAAIGDIHSGYDAAKKAGEQYVAAGQGHLHRIGVLPWAAFADGQLPRRWWEAPALATKIDRWRSIRGDFPEPAPALDAVIEAHSYAPRTEAALSALAIRRRADEIASDPWRWGGSTPAAET